MKWLYTIVFVYSVLSLGCASYSVSVPSQDSVHKEYRDGVEILTSDMSRSLVHFEIAQHTIGGADNVPLAIFILAQVKTGQDFLFDWDCVLASQDNKRVEILSYEAATQSNLDFGKAIESFGIFTPREKSSSQFSSTPSPSHFNSIPASLKASSQNSRTVCISPVAITKSSGVSCCRIIHIHST